MTTHGLCYHPLYTVHQSMIRRCYSPKFINYYNYGGRGITVCDEWKDFLNFYKWAITNGYEKGLSIDRVNNNGNYEPSNCKWSTSYEQNNNQRSNRYFTFNGETKTMTNWARELNRDVSTVCYHVDKISKWIYNSFKI